MSKGFPYSELAASPIARDRASNEALVVPGSLRLNPFGSVERERGQPCQIVIAYDKVAAGRRAMQLVSALHSQDELDFEIRTFPWRFDLLENPDWRELASADALKADLLFISTFSNSELPSAVWKWIAECLTLKCGDSAAVVALFGADGRMDRPDSVRLRLLKTATQDAGLEFFAPSPGWGKSMNDTRSEQTMRVEFIPRSVDEVLYPGVFNRDWGLNE